MIKPHLRYRTTMARVVIIIMLLIIVRSLGDALYHFRTQHALTSAQLNMYLVGSLVAASASLLLLFLYFLGKFTWIVILGTVTIVTLIGIKVFYAGWAL